MKKLIVFLFTLAIYYAKAQSSCENAAPFCAGGVSGVNFPATTGTTTGQLGPDYDCNGLQANPVSYYVPSPSWYYIQVGASGSLDISIQGVLGTPPNTSPGGDVDFVCWGPFNTLANVCNSLTAAFSVDCSYSPSSTESLNIPNGVTGQYYMVVITNFYNQPQNIVLNQYGGTGNTNCSLIGNSSICAGSSKTITVSNTSTLTNVSYSIQPGGLTNTTGSFVVTPSVTTSYTTYLTGLNGLNNPVTEIGVANVTVNPQPLTALTTTQTTCTSTLNAFNLGLTFNPTSPVPGYTVAWAPTIPNGITGITQTSLAGGIAPNSYTALITAQGGCSTSAVVNMSLSSLPNFTITNVTGSPSITCTYTSIDVTSASNYTNPVNYFWSSASFTASTQSVTLTNPGTYSCIVTDPVTGCSVTHSIAIYINTAIPSVSASPNSQGITCGAGVVATATGVAISPTTNITQCWYAPGGGSPVCSGGQVSIFNPVIVGGNGTNTLVITNDLNGCSASKTVQVVSIAGNYPVFTVSSPQQFTVGCSTTSLTTIVIVGPDTYPPPGGGPVSFTVLPPGFAGGLNYTYGSTLSYTVNTPGTYTVIVKDNTNLCETRLAVPLIQNTFTPNISASVITQTLDCTTPSLVLSGVSSNNNVTYSWKTNQVPPFVPGYSLVVHTTTAGASVPSATLIDNYTLTIVDNSNLCISNTIVPMYQNTRPPKPVISNALPLTCAINVRGLSNSSTTNILAGTFFTINPVAATLWEGPTPQQPQTGGSSYQASTPGTYSMTVVDRNNGCTAFTTAVVGDNLVYPVLSTSTLVALDCNNVGDTLKVKVLGLTASDVNALWTAPPGANTSTLNALNLFTNGVGRYAISVTTKSNSCSSSISVFVFNGALTAGFTPDKSNGFAPLTVNFNNQSTSTSSTTGTSSITAVWSFGNGTTRTTTSNITTSAVYNQPGTYTVTMFASKGSCRDTVVKIITVDIPSKLEVPNVFTPNGDNSNDIFFVKSANLTEITALIFDRWGNKIYELTTDKGNIAWDGKTQTGKDAPDGTYFYIITAKGKDGQSYDTKGTVSLYR